MSENGEGRNRLSSVLILASVIAGILILGDLNRRMANARRLERDAVQLETEVAVMATERVQLMTGVAEATSESIIAEWAHSDAKLVDAHYSATAAGSNIWRNSRSRGDQ